jgi:hypothetical protein
MKKKRGWGLGENEFFSRNSGTKLLAHIKRQKPVGRAQVTYLATLLPTILPIMFHVKHL